MRKYALFFILAVCFPCPGAFSGDEAVAHAERGDRLRAEGRFEEAVAEYKEALRLSGVLQAAALDEPRAGTEGGWAVRRHREAIRLSRENPEAL